MGPAGLEEVFRDEYGSVLATVIRRLGDIDLAEDAVADAIEAAAKTWPGQGVPPNPAGWLVTTAVRRAIDRIRRESTRDARQREAMVVPEEPADTGPVTDDRLRLVFTCCHPALAVPARVALTLRLLGGLSVAEIAAAFLVEETTMAQRITRAKRKIAQARIPYRIPQAADLPGRLSSVLAVLFLIYNEGYLGTAAPTRDDLCAEAIRLARTLHALMDDPETAGLLALLLLLQARRPARVTDGRLVPLDEQDRALWSRALIDEGHALVRDSLQRNEPGYYQILAAINAVHTDGAATDWTQVVALYDQLLVIAPTPVVRLNRAVAVAELDGPQVGLALIEALPLQAYHPWHATRAEFLRRLGRNDEADAAYSRAIELTENAAEQAFLRIRRSGPE